MKATPETRADPKLAQQLELANTLIRLSPNGVLAVDLDLRITEWNPLMQRICGLDREHAIGQHLADIPFFKETGEADRIREGLDGKVVGHREVVYRLPGAGKESYFESIMVQLRGPTGKMIGAALRLRDITERKRMADASIESEQRLRTVLDSVQAGIVIIDPEGHRIVDVNPFAAGMIGLPRETIIGAVCHKFICPAEENHCPITDHHQTVDNKECVLLVPAGEQREIIKTVSVVQFDGRSHLLESFIDITERKRSEGKILKLNQALEDKVQQLLESQRELEQHRAHIEGIVAQRTASLTEAQRIALLGNWEWDIVNDTLSWSDEIYRIFGLAPQQFGASYEAFLSAVHPEDRQLVDEKVREALARQHTYSIEHRILQPDGTLRHVHEQAEVIRGEDGQPLKMLGTVQDITERKQMETELRESELAYRTLSQNLPGIVYRVFVREGGRTQFYSDMPVQMTGYTADVWTTGKVCSIEPLILDEDRPGVKAEVLRAIEEKRAFVVEYRLKHKDGGTHWMAEHGMPVYAPDGEPLYIDGVIFDVTAHKQDEIKLQLFRALLDNSSDAIEVIDPVTEQLIDVNATQCAALGYSREELLSMKISDIETGFTENQIDEIKAQISRTGEARFETMHRRKDDTTFPVEVSAKLVELDKPYGLNIVRDITERKRAEAEVQKLQEQLREQALHDPLTGLYNRRYLDESIKRELARAARNDQPVGIVMCDLDHFKFINDTYGHLAGDKVLRVFSELLREQARGSDIVCRFGGEEFVMFVPDMSPKVAYQRAEQLRTELAAKRITLGTTVIQMTASFGVAAFPENGKTMDSLISAVDAAMYQAKRAGRNCVVVSSLRPSGGGSAHLKK